MEKLKDKIERYINKTGVIRTPAYFIKDLFNDIINIFYSLKDSIEINKNNNTSNSKIINKLQEINNYLLNYNKFKIVYKTYSKNDYVETGNAVSYINGEIVQPNSEIDIPIKDGLPVIYFNDKTPFDLSLKVIKELNLLDDVLINPNRMNYVEELIVKDLNTALKICQYIINIDSDKIIINGKKMSDMNIVMDDSNIAYLKNKTLNSLTVKLNNELIGNFINCNIYNVLDIRNVYSMYNTFSNCFADIMYVGHSGISPNYLNLETCETNRLFLYNKHHNHLPNAKYVNIEYYDEEIAKTLMYLREFDSISVSYNISLLYYTISYDGYTMYFNTNKDTLLFVLNNNKNKTEIVIPEHCKLIKRNAFCLYKSLTSITIPDDCEIEDIDNTIFDLPNLTNLIITENNKYYIIIDNVLYNKDITIIYGALNSVENINVPETLNSEQNGVNFSNCKNLKTINFNHINVLHHINFTNCENLTEILSNDYIFYDQVNFKNCINLTTVKFSLWYGNTENYYYHYNNIEDTNIKSWDIQNRSDGKIYSGERISSYYVPTITEITLNNNNQDLIGATQYYKKLNTINLNLSNYVNYDSILYNINSFSDNNINVNLLNNNESRYITKNNSIYSPDGKILYYVPKNIMPDLEGVEIIKGNALTNNTTLEELILNGDVIVEYNILPNLTKLVATESSSIKLVCDNLKIGYVKSPNNLTFKNADILFIKPNAMADYPETGQCANLFIDRLDIGAYGGSYDAYTLVNKLTVRDDAYVTSDYGIACSLRDTGVIEYSTENLESTYRQYFINPNKQVNVYICDLDKNLYTVDEWNLPNEQALGVVIGTDEHKFIISKTNAFNYSTYWGANIEISDIPLNDIQSFDGKSLTLKLIKELKNLIGDNKCAGANAAEFCNEYIFPNGECGYLGTFAEWKWVINNVDLVDEALLKCGGIGIKDNGSYWTSTIYNKDSAYIAYLFDGNIREKRLNAYNVRAFLLY